MSSTGGAASVHGWLEEALARGCASEADDLLSNPISGRYPAGGFTFSRWWAHKAVPTRTAPHAIQSSARADTFPPVE